MPQFLACLLLTKAKWHYRVAGLLLNWGDWDAYVKFFLRSSKITMYFVESIQALLSLSVKSMDSTPQLPKWNAENFIHRLVETKFCWGSLAFFMPNSSVFFPCWGDVKNSYFITCDNTCDHHRSHVRCTRNFQAPSTPLVYSCRAAVWVAILRTLLCNPQWQEHIIRSYGKLWYCFVHQWIPNSYKLCILGHVWEL